MVFVKKGVVVPRGDAGDFDYYGTLDLSIIKHAGRFFLYYSTFTLMAYRIGLAISKDGITFVKKGRVLPLSGEGDFDYYNAFKPSIIKHAGRFFLYYVGYDGSNYRIGLAISKDGITFVKKGVILPLGGVADFDESNILDLSIIKPAGRFFLYYVGRDGSKSRIGLAISKDGITFVKKGVILPLGGVADFDESDILDLSIIKHAGRFFLYYAGYDGSNPRIGLAISKDGL